MLLLGLQLAFADHMISLQILELVVWIFSEDDEAFGGLFFGLVGLGFGFFLFFPEDAALVQLLQKTESCN